ncbi:hypothetical protein HS088_TW03G00331 [Tripterygium wilfordii]|uniref:RRM domain-containing protein n=1 Tax=Tripterygium wilfordii TaxID=458696 RepID=A0A7J7DUF5_TRIWF|nr:hypothetical protein HS088_TW03G00331 [Tripterygium wilfordii]
MLILYLLNKLICYARFNQPARRTRRFPWQHDLFEDSLRAAGIAGVEVGTKLNVSNLDSGVSNEDIRELFAEIGDLERYAIHYDKNGRPGGSAEVVYTRRSDAFAALKRYNNVLLDGKPMKLEVVGANVEIPVSARVNVTGENGRRKRTVVMTPGAGLNGGGSSINRGSGQNRRWAMRNGRGRGAMGNGRGHGAMGNGRGHGAMGNGRGRGRGAARGWGHGWVRGHGRGRKQPFDQSADDLNDDLEKYHAEAMQT